MGEISRPSRYFGAEINPYKKPEKADCSFLLSFPEVYELGMSHYGFLFLYRMLKEKEGYLVDRVFAPWVDREAQLRDTNEELRSREFRVPLKKFDIIGFSLAYELSLTNALTILELGGIPLQSEKRKKGDPLVLGGGVLTANPEPLAPFFDALFIGEGEEGLFEITEKVKSMGGRRGDRAHILKELSSIESVYVPTLYTPVYDRKGTLKGIDRADGAPGKIRKRVIPDLNRFPLPTKQIIPAMRTVHDRLGIEIARGCTRGCRFCQAGYYYRPFRERDGGKILDYLEKVAGTSGFDETGFLSLSSSDYSCVNELVTEALNILEKERISVSLPSLRINSITEELVKELKRVRKSGFTIAPEAGSENLRKKINKVISDREIFDTVEWIFKNGWKNVKMYFMIGLPGEGKDDLTAIAELARNSGKIGRRFGRKTNVTVSISTFVPKAHTPFQWVAQISREEMEEKISLLKDLLKRERNISLKWHDPQMSWLEGILARGDRRIGRLVLEAYRKGARFDGWSDLLDLQIWEDALASLSIDPGNYTGPRDMESFLPWDIVDSAVSKPFLIKEWERFTTGEETDDCRIGSCSGCGVCKPSKRENIYSTGVTGSARTTSHGNEGAPGKYLMVYRKGGGSISQSALEIQSIILRAFRKSGTPLLYSNGFNPKPRVSFPSALPVGVESECEFLLFSLTEERAPDELLAQLRSILPGDLAPLAIMPIEGKISSLETEETFSVTFKNTLPDFLLPVSLIGKAAGEDIVKTEMVDGTISITTCLNASKSGVKRVRDLISSCACSGMELQITKNTMKIFHLRGDERKQIYPD